MTTDPLVKQVIANLVDYEYKGEVAAVATVIVHPDGSFQMRYSANNPTRMQLVLGLELIRDQLKDELKNLNTVMTKNTD